jgi:hypothetical protein
MAVVYKKTHNFKRLAKGCGLMPHDDLVISPGPRGDFTSIDKPRLTHYPPVKP